MVVGARQSFQFFRKITWFLGNNGALSKFRYMILHYLISIIKLLKKKQSVKANFMLTKRATLTQKYLPQIYVVFSKPPNFIMNMSSAT